MIQKETGERINKDQKEVTEQLKGSKMKNIGKEDHIGKETTQQVDHRTFKFEQRFKKPGSNSKRISLSETEENESETNKALAITSLGCMKKQEEIFTLLKCIKVTIYNPQKTHLKKRVIAFLDPGSERSYISEELGKGLELEK